jgi:hypothetical protein
MVLNMVVKIVVNIVFNMIFNTSVFTLAVCFIASWRGPGVTAAHTGNRPNRKTSKTTQFSCRLFPLEARCLPFPALSYTQCRYPCDECVPVFRV